METRLLHNVSWSHFLKFTKRRKNQNNLERLRQNANPSVLKSILLFNPIVGTILLYLQNADFFVYIFY